MTFSICVKCLGGGNANISGTLVQTGNQLFLSPCRNKVSRNRIYTVYEFYIHLATSIGNKV
jgi:hypothetical protein